MANAGGKACPPCRALSSVVGRGSPVLLRLYLRSPRRPRRTCAQVEEAADPTQEFVSQALDAEFGSKADLGTVVITGFHSTSAESLDKIMTSGKLIAGTGANLGAGVYIRLCTARTNTEAMRKKWIEDQAAFVEVSVRVGTVAYYPDAVMHPCRPLARMTSKEVITKFASGFSSEGPELCIVDGKQSEAIVSVKAYKAGKLLQTWNYED